MPGQSGADLSRFMLPIVEDKRCYASPVQREVLLDLIRHNLVTENFFLTGGTALSVFYLHHRQSNDLDLFTRHNTDLGELDFAMKGLWRREYVRVRSSDAFLSLIIRGVRVDFVVDPLSLDEPRDSVVLELSHHLRLDTLRNVLSNKLCALASRLEPKDYIDYYALCGALGVSSFKPIFDEARKKDAIFDDPPTVAYQIEQGFSFLQSNPVAMPELLLQLDQKKFKEFYDGLVRWMYDLAAGGG